jgi:hypothetical protein
MGMPYVANWRMYHRHFGLLLSPVGSGWSLVGPMRRRTGERLGGLGPESRWLRYRGGNKWTKVLYTDVTQRREV